MADEKKKQNRQKRLSQQLRANLLRRKAQARDRLEQKGSPDAEETGNGNKKAGV